MKNKKIFTGQSWDKMKTLFQSPTFRKNFTLLACIMIGLFLLFALYTYHQTGVSLEQELITASQTALENTAQSVDSHMRDIRYVLSLMETNDMSRIFFSSTTPTLYYDNFYALLQEYLEACVNSHTSIDSIYLYSTCSQSVLTHLNKYSTQRFPDAFWLEMVDKSSSDIQILFRAKNENFPYLITLVKWFQIDGYDSGIVINVDARNIPSLEQFEQVGNQSIYLVSEDGNIIYCHGQSQLFMPIDSVPELSHFNPNAEEIFNFHKEGNQVYTYNQIHSPRYKWHYVSLNYTAEYGTRLSDSRALMTAVFSLILVVGLLLAILISARSVKPIQDLLEFLKAPNGPDVADIKDNREIASIAAEIVRYVEQNQSLSDELSERISSYNEAKLVALQTQINPHFLFNTLNLLHVQECEALGFDHPIPKLTLNTSKLLRYAIDGIEQVPLETELKFTKVYLDILSNRYNNLFQVRYHVQEPCLQVKVPKLIIQPLIENAVFHGLAGVMDEHSVLELNCYMVENACIVEVRDNGSGISPETLEKLKSNIQDNISKRGGIGLKNVTNRMRLLYGDEYTLTVSSEVNQGSVFALRFPISG